MRTKPKLNLDIATIEALAGRGLTNVEICAMLGICEKTLYNHKRENTEFASAIKRGKANAHAVIANALFEKACAGNLGAIIWYEKTRCGLSDRHNVIHQQSDAPAVTVEGYHYEQAVATIAPTKDEG